VFFLYKEALLHRFVHSKNHSILGTAAKGEKPARLAQISCYRKAFLASLKSTRFLSAASCYRLVPTDMVFEICMTRHGCQGKTSDAVGEGSSHYLRNCGIHSAWGDQNAMSIKSTMMVS
jgi:hypothetical protein